MKKYEDFSEDNAFFSAEKEIVELPELDIIPSESGKRRGEDIKESNRGVRFFSLGILMIVAAAAIMCILIFLVSSREPEPIQVGEDPRESEEWRGAFLDRGIYDGCVDTAVTLQMGNYGSESVWSGFLLSSDGWIATSAQRVDRVSKGRIYATLGDGREYAVEKLLCDGEVALLKISAQGLPTVSLADRELQSGERIISVSAGGDLCSGEISNPQTLKLNISLEYDREGSPLYDSEGTLVGMACLDEDGRTAYALSAESIGKAFSRVK